MANNRPDFDLGPVFCGQWSTVDCRLWNRQSVDMVNRSRIARTNVARRDCTNWECRRDGEWPWSPGWNRDRCDNNLAAFSHPSDDSCWVPSRIILFQFLLDRRDADDVMRILNRNLEDRKLLRMVLWFKLK